MEIAAVQVTVVKQDLKPWRCGKGSNHVLGMVRRNGSGVRELLLYRHAIDMDADLPDEVDVIGVVRGEMMEVRCSICGGVRTWFEASN